MNKSKNNTSRIVIGIVLLLIIILLGVGCVKAFMMRQPQDLTQTNGEVSLKKFVASQYNEMTANTIVHNETATLYGSVSGSSRGITTPGDDSVILDPLAPPNGEYVGDINAGDADDGNYNSTEKGIGSYVGDTEFMIFDDQVFTSVTTLMSFANPSVNAERGNYPMSFTVYDKTNLNTALFTTALVYPGETIAVDMSKYLKEVKVYQLRIVSTPRTEADSTGHFITFNALEQDIKAEMKTLTSSVTTGQTVTEQGDGAVYSTAVYLDTNGIKAGVTLPRLLVVQEGKSGTDITANYRFSYVTPKFSCKLIAGDKLSSGTDKHETYLTATKNVNSGAKDLNTLSALISIEDEKSIVNYDDATNDNAHEYSVGPIHCVLEGDAIAQSDYYGTTRFRIEISKGA